MDATTIRKLAESSGMGLNRHGLIPVNTENTWALFEIAAQLAELNETLQDANRIQRELFGAEAVD
jgi:hypothetical protein